MDDEEAAREAAVDLTKDDPHPTERWHWPPAVRQEAVKLFEKVKLEMAMESDADVDAALTLSLKTMGAAVNQNLWRMQAKLSAIKAVQKDRLEGDRRFLTVRSHSRLPLSRRLTLRQSAAQAKKSQARLACSRLALHAAAPLFSRTYPSQGGFTERGKAATRGAQMLAAASGRGHLDLKPSKPQPKPALFDAFAFQGSSLSPLPTAGAEACADGAGRSGGKGRDYSRRGGDDDDYDLQPERLLAVWRGPSRITHTAPTKAGDDAIARAAAGALAAERPKRSTRCVPSPP